MAFHLSVCLLSLNRLENLSPSISSSATWHWNPHFRQKVTIKLASEVAARAVISACARGRVVWFLCVYWASDWSPVARTGELCELWCSLTAAFSWKASLWGPAGFQCAHLHIKTAQERDSAQGGWGAAEGREGRVMKDALFSLFTLRVGQGF